MREFWDQHYADDAYIFGTAPNIFLAAQQHLLKPGQHALAVADGEGRNGVWLAQQGLEVLALDISPVGVAKARKLAEANGVAIQFEIADTRNWDWPENSFDVVAAIFIQFASPEERSQLFHNLARALKPGGYLILQGYTPKQIEYKTGGPPNAANMYTSQLLRESFAGTDILHLREHEEFIAEGTKHYGMSALIDMVAQKRR